VSEFFAPRPWISSSSAFNATFKNDTLQQHVYTISEDVLHQVVFDNKPLGSGEFIDLQLVADDNEKGQATHQYSGGVANKAADILDRDNINGD
jgi:hypothetical protein